MNQTIPVYNYLFENITEFQRNNRLSFIVNEAISFSLQKLEDYYSITDELVYIIATSIVI